MKIFLSHNNRDKPLLREIQRFLPKFLGVWIDEIEIPYGTNLSKSIKSAIQEKTDVLIIFLTNEAVKSDWVQKELKWALEREERESRNSIIPVLIDQECWRRLPINFQERKFIPCHDFTLDGIKTVSNKIYTELFAYFLQSIEFITEDELKSRKKNSLKIARFIIDEQSKAVGNEMLTQARLQKIISYIDPLNKLLLLVLYELLFGKSSEILSNKQLENISFLSVEFDVPDLGIWLHKIDWKSKSLTYRELSFEYGLGYSEFLVRDVFLNELNNLESSERNKLFYDIKIIQIFPDK